MPNSRNFFCGVKYSSVGTPKICCGMGGYLIRGRKQIHTEIMLIAQIMVQHNVPCAISPNVLFALVPSSGPLKS